jgi:hypothetical protein
MWSSIQRHVFDAASRRHPGARALIVAFSLLESLCEVQSGASDAVPAAMRSLDEYASARDDLECLARPLAQGDVSSPDRWLALAFLADLRAELGRVWNELYAPVCAAHPELGARVDELRRWLDALPFEAWLRHIELAWGEAEADPLVDAIAAVCLADLPARAAEPTYQRLFEKLDLQAPFLSATTAAYAVEKLLTRGCIELAAVPAPALAVLSLLSNFHSFESGSWG